MIDHEIVDMINGAVHEIVEQDFLELDLAMRNWTVGSMLDYRNQNSRRPSV